MRVLIILLLIALALTYTPTHSTYSYTYFPSTLYLSMSNDGSAYSCINNNAIEYYRKVNNTYTLRSRAYLICITNFLCIPSWQKLTYDGLRILAFSYNDAMLNVYKIINQTIVFHQAIPSMPQSIILRQNFLLLYDPSLFSFEYYNYNPTTGLYQLIISSNFTTSALKAAISSDGRYLVGLTTSLTIYVFTYDGTTFVQPAAGSPVPIPPANGSASSVIDAKIQQINSTTYALIILYSTATTHLLQYYAMVAGVVSFVQQLDQSYLIWNIYLTKNAKYLLSGVSNSSIKMYQFDASTNRYILTHSFTNFYGGFPNPIFIAEDASFLFGSIADGTFYFVCDVPYCATCSSLGQCMVCASTFTLTSTNTCACTSAQSLVGSSCVSCKVSKCGACSSSDICSSCANGYTLVGNSCVCPANSTVSLDNSCVSCKVSYCYRCDQPDLCALFSPVQPTDGSGVSISQVAALVLLAVVLIAVSVGLIYLAIKMKSLTNSFSRLHSEYPNPQNQTIETQANYQSMMKTNSGLEQPAPRGKKRRARNQELHLQQIASMQMFVQEAK